MVVAVTVAAEKAVGVFRSCLFYPPRSSMMAEVITYKVKQRFSSNQTEVDP